LQINIPKVLSSAVKVKATEARVEVGAPTQLIISGQLRTLFASTVNARDFEEGIIRRLDAFKREQLRSTGRCEWQFDESGIGQIQAEIEPTRARFLLPAVEETRPTKQSPGDAKRGFFSRLFGGG
jgi:Tfp pilus assembly pilus retraction ATPase PilT